MTDEMLLGLDEAVERASKNPRKRRLLGARPRTTAVGPPLVETEGHDTESDVSLPGFQNPVLWLGLFLAIQYLLNGLIFLPGAQSFRSIVRAAPYLTSLAFLIAMTFRAPAMWAPPSTPLLVGSLAVLVLNLMHSTSQVSAGIGQCVFQLCIAAPLFWGYKIVNRPKQLHTMLVLIFAMNFVSAGVGILQVYFPDRFMPSQLSLQLEDRYRESLSYEGSDGRMITRPPGLSDVPGGAAVAGGLTAILGLGLALRARSVIAQLMYVSAGTIGLATVYLTQVRSVLLMVIVGVGMLAAVAIRRGRLARGGLILGFGAIVIVGAFSWASALGGNVIDERFLSIRDQGALSVYQENRGGFLATTLGEQLDRYPLGAGIGRWGMMNTSLGDNTNPATQSIHVEIQLTGWLLDGGLPLWFFYGGAILIALFAAWRATAASDTYVAEIACAIFAAQVFIVGLGMSGPVFNTQTGLLFWLLTATLYAVARTSQQNPQLPNHS